MYAYYEINTWCPCCNQNYVIRMKNSEDGSVVYLCESCGNLWEQRYGVECFNYLKDVTLKDISHKLVKIKENDKEANIMHSVKKMNIVKWCGFCDQGNIVMAKNKNNGRLLCICNECELTNKTPAHVLKA